MKLILAGLRDEKRDILNVLTFKSEGEAIRSFSQLCKDEKSEPYLFPEDFTLIKMGILETDNGVITPQMELLARAIHFVKKGEENAQKKS